MPKIEIETCSRTPNYCALEAIARVIRNNYTQRKSRKYLHENIIKVESGRVLKVTEEPADLNAESPCSCKFKVEKVDEAKTIQT
jgi:hypothetical protein